MQTEKYYTWLPCFPGFYESILYNPDMEYHTERAILRDNWHPIPLSLMDYWLQHRRCGRKGEMKVRYKEYEKDVAKAFCEVVADTLYEILDSDVRVEFEGIQRPREYNFRTDTVHCSIEFPVEKALEYCRSHLEAFREYLLANYKSRDGFMSFHPYDPSEWLKAENWGGHEPGAILDFILRDYLDYDDASYILSVKALEDVCFDNYCDLPPKLNDFLESEEAQEIGSEYSRLMEQGQMYIEAMHNSERSQKLIAAVVEDLKKRMSKKMDSCIRAL